MSHRNLSAYSLLFNYLFLFPCSGEGIAVYLFKFLHPLEMFLGLHVLDTLLDFL